MTDSLNPLWATLVGGALSLSGSLIATWWSKRLDGRNSSRQLAKAIKGELSAIIHIVELRRYSEIIRGHIKLMRESGQAILFYAPVRDEYCRVFKGNADKIGTLAGGLPTDVAIVYTQIASVLEDFAVLDHWAHNPSAPAERTPQQLILRYQVIADLIDDTMSRATKLIDDFDSLYP